MSKFSRRLSDWLKTPEPLDVVDYPPIRLLRPDLPFGAAAKLPPEDAHAECLDKERVMEAIDRFVAMAEVSVVWTRNERRAARSIALYLQQTLKLPITYGP